VEDDDKPKLTSQERAKRAEQRKAYRADEHFANYRQFKRTLQLRRIHTSSSNFNCLAFSTFGAAGRLSPSAPDAASRAAGDATRKQIHDELMKRLSRFSHNASDVWHGGLSRTDAESIFRVCGAVIQWMAQPLLIVCPPLIALIVCVAAQGLHERGAHPRCGESALEHHLSL
jgi:hypothetical protein